MLQRSSEWHERRCGHITASRMAAVLALGKRDGRPLQARQDYAGDLVCELLTGEPRGVPTTPAMQWGKDCEEAARTAYEAKRGLIVANVGFLIHPSVPYVGASPDGLVGEDGQSEIKCPYNPLVHCQTLLDGMPDDHMPQVQA